LIQEAGFKRQEAIQEAGKVQGRFRRQDKFKSKI